MIEAGYGQKIPESGDKGTQVFGALEGNIQGFVDHTHNGINSSLISAMSITKEKVNLAPGSWEATTSGYKQTVSAPGAVTLDKVGMRFRVRTGPLQNAFINPTVIPLSLTQFEVHVNDSSLDLECLFL